MSMMCEGGLKVVLPRTGPDDFWKIVQQHYAGDDSQKWKCLAMLALRENAGWPLEQIGRVFDHNKGHVTRCLGVIKEELRGRFRMSPELLEFGDEEGPRTGIRNQESGMRIQQAESRGQGSWNE